MIFSYHKGRDQFLLGKRRQVADGADIRGINAEKIHVKHIGFGAHAGTGNGTDRVQCHRREKNEVAGLYGIGLQMRLIDAASLLDQRKFRLLVPVRRDSRVRIRKFGDILLERKHLLPVFCFFLLLRCRGRDLFHTCPPKFV